MQIKPVKIIFAITAIVCCSFSLRLAAQANQNIKPSHSVDDYLETLPVSKDINWSMRVLIYKQGEMQIVFVNKRWDNCFEYSTVSFGYESANELELVKNMMLKPVVVCASDAKFKKQFKSLASFEKLKMNAIPTSDISMHSEGLRIISKTRTCYNRIDLLRHEIACIDVIKRLREFVDVQE